MVLKKGFTLVELLVVMSLVVILAVTMVGILNPKALVGKANDSRRKKDIARIKIAFEEYYNDKGCYPSETEITEYMKKSSCGSDVFSPYLNEWPCDPHGQNYLIAVESTSCPHWYKLATMLENKNDTDIPKAISSNPAGVITNTNANYGESSSNISWNEENSAPVGAECMLFPFSSDPEIQSHYGDSCFAIEGSCQQKLDGCLGDTGNCFARNYKTQETCGSACRLKPDQCCGQACAKAPYNMFK